jgi:hypothetical protein
VSRIRKASLLAAVDCLNEGAVEKSVLHVELLNWLVTGNSNGEYRAHGGQFHNRAECLIVVHTRALSETPEDPTSLVAIEGAVGAKLVDEDSLAGDDVRATRPKNKFSGPVAHEGPYSSSIAARQLGSVSAAQTEDGIGDGGKAVKVNGFVAI